MNVKTINGEKLKDSLFNNLIEKLGYSEESADSLAQRISSLFTAEVETFEELKVN